MLNDSSWLQADSPVTSPVRPLCPREPTFKFELPLFWIFVGCTSSSGLSGWRCRWSEGDTQRKWWPYPRIEKGFDFLGYDFGPDGLGVARATIEKFIERASRLYEQERMGTVAPDALGMYLRQWCAWSSGGLGPASGSGSVPSFVYAGFYAALS